jgi:phenylacetate-CoA ligase
MDKIINLQRVIEAAAIAPGNRDRFIQCGLAPNNPNWHDAFLQLQPIDKQTIRQNPGLFLAQADDIVYRGSTSGSRGQSYVYFAGNQWNEARIAARRRSLAWWGIDDDIPIVNVASRLLPIRKVDMAVSGKIDRAFLSQLINLLKKRPVVIRGYPSRLCEVASYLNPIPVLAVICTGECLFDYQKALLEEVFQAPVINEYGCQETGVSGLSCPEKGNLHLDSDRCLYEIIDGELVTTDLYNTVMPLVRYKSGDILQLDSCDCRRGGITAKIKGRIEDRICTKNVVKYAGEIIMPPLEGILSYQVVREKDSVDIKIQSSSNEISLNPLQDWTKSIFGEVKAQVFLDDTPLLDTIPKLSYNDAEWTCSLTQQPWSKWLNQPVKFTGMGSKAAQLLQQLVEPKVLANTAIAPQTQAMLEEVLASPVCQNPDVERMINRVLLFACSNIGDENTIASIYTRATGYVNAIDLLIPTLGLPDFTSTIELSTEYQLDTFSIHHLLHTFESAVTKRNSQSIARPLNPILAVLIGDLNFFAPRFSPLLIARWFELLYLQPFPYSFPDPQDEFLTAWLQWRKAMINGDTGNLSALQQVAATPQEQARVYLEKGYSLLVCGRSLNPDEWLEIIKVHAGVISHALADDIDLMPWIPIVRNLAAPLLKQGNRQMAYQCLVASAPPSSRTSAFESIAFQVNDKQSAICDYGINLTNS